MTSYRVCFFNEIPRNDRLFKCCQRSIVIRAARTPERAIEAAKKRFSRLEGIRDWKIHAGLVEIEPIDLEPIPQKPIATASGKHGHEKDVRHRALSGSPDRVAQRDGEGGVSPYAQPSRRRRAGDREGPPSISPVPSAPITTLY
jgi:hypothetical protein